MVIADPGVWTVEEALRLSGLIFEEIQKKMITVGVQHVVVIIPSKELVHYPLVAHMENTDMEELIKSEIRFYGYLIQKLKQTGSQVIDLTQDLQSLISGKKRPSGLPTRICLPKQASSQTRTDP